VTGRFKMCFWRYVFVSAVSTPTRLSKVKLGIHPIIQTTVKRLLSEASLPLYISHTAHSDIWTPWWIRHAADRFLLQQQKYQDLKERRNKWSCEREICWIWKWTL